MTRSEQVAALAAALDETFPTQGGNTAPAVYAEYLFVRLEAAGLTIAPRDERVTGELSRDQATIDP